MSTVEHPATLPQPPSDVELATTPAKPVRGEPTWGVARLYPLQGHWTEAEYLALSEQCRAEFTDGVVEFLPMPTRSHQLINGILYRMLFAFVDQRRLGTVFFAGRLIKLRAGKIREPDLVFVSFERDDPTKEPYQDGADLVMEVVSEDRRRDLVQKRQDYAEAGIAEYWIVDPRDEQITVLALEGSAYVEGGVFGKGMRAASRLLPGFEVDVSAAFTPA